MPESAPRTEFVWLDVVTGVGMAVRHVGIGAGGDVDRFASAVTCPRR